MILNDGKKDIDTNFEKTSSFRIAANSKMFEILSSKLYADPIAAIIRELSTNAIDSHIAAGIENVPFTAHLPTLLEPWFSVTDTGIGMSHDEILQVYTEYGNSQKDDSNLYNGALGLGSKSPFGYTQEFTVVSAKDGVKNTYLCYINKGFPDISLISTEEDKVNGVTVQVPVKPEDHKRFTITAGRIYSFFKTRPTVNQQLKYAKIEKLTDKISKVTGVEQLPPTLMASGLGKFHGMGFHPYDESHMTRRDTMYILQSNVAYPVSEKHAEVIFATKDKDQKKAEANYELWDFFRLMLTDPNSAFVLSVENGSVSFTPNREEISLDERTIETILAILREFQEQHLQVIEKDLEPLSYHQFVKKHGHFINQMANRGSSRKEYINFIKRHPAYAKCQTSYHGFSFVTDYEFKVTKHEHHKDYVTVNFPWLTIYGNPSYGFHSGGQSRSMYTAQVTKINTKDGNDERANCELTFPTNTCQAIDTAGVFILVTDSIDDLLKSVSKDFYQSTTMLMHAIGFDNRHTGNPMVVLMEPDYAEQIKANPAFKKVFPKVTFLNAAEVSEQIKALKAKQAADKPKKPKATPRTLEEKILVYKFSRKDGTVTLASVKEAAGNYAVLGESKTKYQRFKNMDGSISFYGWEHYRRIAAFLNQDIYIFTETSYALALRNKYTFKDLKADPLDTIKKDLENPEMVEALYCFELLFPSIEDKEKAKVAKLQEQTKDTKLGDVLKLIVDNWAVATIVRSAIRTGIFKNPYKGKYTILKGLNIGHGKGVTKDTIALLTLIEKHYIGETNV